MNYNPFPYGQIQNSPLSIVQTQSLFEPSIQIPLIQKKNNNKNNKILSLNKNKNQNEKNEDNDEESDMNSFNENNTFNTPSKKKTMENIPQLINSFYFLNENIKKKNNNQTNEITINSINNNEENKNINNDKNIINNLKNNKIKEKSKHKKHNCFFNKNLLQILENFDLTNEEKLLYILDNFKNIKIDPLILKVLEYRKINRKNGLNESNNLNANNDNQNSTSLKSGSNKKNGINNSNNIQSSLNNENNSYIAPQPVKPSFPMDDKILFKNLEKYKISFDILDRPSPIKIDLDFNILNKLFIIWDFLITFKEIVFTEKIYDFEINKNILTFYSNLIDTKNNYQYYKSIFISLLLLCVKNIPIMVQTPKEPRLFLLKSILDNLHSISYNIIYDSPLVILKEITDSYLYRNLIEENNLQILKKVLENSNNINNKENFEKNKIYKKEEEKEDNISNIENNTKIYLLHIIIGLCFETILIKDKIKVEYDNMNSLSYTKKGLDESLFDTEKRMKELNRMENFKTLGKEIENLEKKLNDLKGNNNMEIEKEEKNEKEEIKIEEEEKNQKDKKEIIKNDNNVIDEQNKKKDIKELETQIDRYKSILIENDKLIERKKEINNKINEIIESIYNLKTLRKKYLGIDYQNNEYYYFISVPNKIYTKNKKRKEWGYFENKEDIQKLINKLTDKGKNEKKLKFFLKFILSQMKEKEEKEKEKEKKDNDIRVINEEKKDKDKDKEEEKNIEENKDKENNNNCIIMSVDDEQKKDEKENKEIKELKNQSGIQIKIDNIQKNVNDEENINKKNNIIHNINLGVNYQKKNKNKQKEEIKIDNIHIMEDDEPEEIEEDKVEIEENDDNEEIISQSKNKININTIKIQTDEKNNKTPVNTAKKELFTFVISEDRLQLNIILMKIDDVFSEYLVQFNKQWESEINRNTWKKLITNNPTDKNILTTLKMFNHKFKNPYKILSIEEEQELIIKEKINKGNNFNFDDENGNVFSIPETNNLLLLSPKVKIWSKEMDLIDIDNYYNNDLLINVYSREQLCYVVHFYEMAIFGLVHRREGKRKL